MLKIYYFIKKHQILHNNINVSPYITVQYIIYVTLGNQYQATYHTT